MELSERIRKARQEAGLSQRQVCGDVITRNMLSQIENGSATPSVATLQYLAQQLGKPVGYFFGEPSAETEGTPMLAKARALFAQGKSREALTLLTDAAPSGELPEEYRLLEYLACLKTAEEELASGNRHFARDILHSIADSRGLYIAQPLQRERLRLLALSGDPTPLPPDDLPLLHRAKAALEEQNYDRAVLLLTAAQEQDDPQWQLLRGHADFAQGLYSTAAAYYRRAEEAYPKEVIPLLEICYRELGDFQQAYAYAVKNRQESS